MPYGRFMDGLCIVSTITCDSLQDPILCSNITHVIGCHADGAYLQVMNINAYVQLGENQNELHQTSTPASHSLRNPFHSATADVKAAKGHSPILT